MTEELELNPEVIKETEHVYSSLTDIYGREIFTDISQLKISNYEKSKENTELVLSSKVFVKEMAADENFNRQIEDKLFMEIGSSKIKQELSTTTNNNSSIYIYSTIVITTIFIVLLYSRYKKIRQERKKDANYNYHLY